MTTISRRRLATEVSFSLEGGTLALAAGTAHEAATLYVQQADSALAFGEGGNRRVCPRMENPKSPPADGDLWYNGSQYP